jgi:hypothetical protein
MTLALEGGLKEGWVIRNENPPIIDIIRIVRILLEPLATKSTSTERNDGIEEIERSLPESECKDIMKTEENRESISISAIKEEEMLILEF